MVVHATIAPGIGGRRAASRRPAAAPKIGPSNTFCGRTPNRPASAPVPVATATVPAPAIRSAAHPTGAISAALAAIRCHSGGISPGRCLARATRSDAANPAAPATAPSTPARAPR
jgi:hypothetical protein